MVGLQGLGKYTGRIRRKLLQTIKWKDKYNADVIGTDGKFLVPGKKILQYTILE